jgi:peptidoglycan hydrolase-like protein with peptidoglycan-binding domain
MPATLRRGSKGPDVVRWQTILGITADGNFGPATESATIAWQKAHKLVPDGVVGPATWDLALVAGGGEGAPVSSSTSATVKVQPTASKATDEWASAVVKRALPAISEAERQYLVTVARGEGFYGKGWGSDPARGAGSNNWGAVQGKGDAGSFQHIDHHADGTAYTTAFKRYGSPEKGAVDMARILLKANVAAALRAGDLEGAVKAQHSNGYFELSPDKYLAAVRQNYGILLANLPDWKPLLTSGTARSAAKIAIVLLLAGAGYALYRARSA